MEEKKRCRKCGIEKVLDEFVKNSRSPEGRATQCKSCQKDESYRRNYGITSVEVAAMLQRQGGCCLICELPIGENRRLALDHHHGTGKVRGVLCNGCNSAIGFLQDNPLLCINAARYLMERPHGKELFDAN